MKVLIACEFSGVVRDAFAALGHDVWSCDLLPTERPGNHIQDDVLKHLDEGWDLMIAHPPCTHLAVCGAPAFAMKKARGLQQQAVDFFMEFVNAPVTKIAIENPVCIMSRLYRKPDQIIHPYYFGHPRSKQICLWLKNLHPLMHSTEDDLFFKKTHVDGVKWYYWIEKKTGKQKRMDLVLAQAKGFGGRATKGESPGHARSRFFPGIAKAMAEQWGAN